MQLFISVHHGSFVGPRQDRFASVVGYYLQKHAGVHVRRSVGSVSSDGAAESCARGG